MGLRLSVSGSTFIQKEGDTFEKASIYNSR